jgi:hypothetical protein
MRRIATATPSATQSTAPGVVESNAFEKPEGRARVSVTHHQTSAGIRTPSKQALSVVKPPNE